MMNVAIFIFGVILSITGFMAIFILSKISNDLKDVIVKVAEHESLIKVIDLKMESKMDKLSCMKNHSNQPV